MRNVSGDNGPVLPWLLIRQDGHGNRYRVGSYATRAEAQQTAERLGRASRNPAALRRPESHAPGTGAASAAGDGADSYLVECRDRGSGARDSARAESGM